MQLAGPILGPTEKAYFVRKWNEARKTNSCALTQHARVQQAMHTDLVHPCVHIHACQQLAYMERLV